MNSFHVRLGYQRLPVDQKTRNGCLWLKMTPTWFFSDVHWVPTQEQKLGRFLPLRLDGQAAREHSDRLEQRISDPLTPLRALSVSKLGRPLLFPIRLKDIPGVRSHAYPHAFDEGTRLQLIAHQGATGLHCPIRLPVRL